MHRAFYGRFESSLTDLPNNFKLNKPKLSEISSIQSRNYSTSPDYCISWSADASKIEVLQSKTGKTVDGKVSWLSKISFFTRYTNLMFRLPNANELYHIVGGNYHETKYAARDYQVKF